MKIAFTAKGDNWEAAIDPRFGRTEFIVVFDEATEELTTVDNRDIVNVEHGAGPKTAQLIFDINPDILITGNGPGGNAAAVLQKANLKVYTGAGDMSIKDAYEAYKKGSLKEG